MRTIVNIIVTVFILLCAGVVTTVSAQTGEAIEEGTEAPEDAGASEAVEASEEQFTLFRAAEGFTLRLPKDWIEIPREALDEYAETVNMMSPDQEEKVSYDYGFQLSYKKKWITYPYIFVKVNRDGRISEQELRNYTSLKETLQEQVNEEETDMSILLSNVEIGETVYDEANQMLWIRSSMDVLLEGKVETLVAAKLTNSGLIMIASYAAGKHFSYYQPAFQEIAASIKIPVSMSYRHNSKVPRSSGGNSVKYGASMFLVAIAIIRIIVRQINH